MFYRCISSIILTKNTGLDYTLLVSVYLNHYITNFSILSLRFYVKPKVLKPSILWLHFSIILAAYNLVKVFTFQAANSFHDHDLIFTSETNLVFITSNG